MNRSRVERRSALRRGTYRLYGQVAPRFWLWTAVILSTFAVGYWKVAQGELESQKAQVMAKQRAVAQVLSPKVLPHTERIEGWVAELAGEWKGDRKEANLDLASLQERPGIYLRVHVDSAQPPQVLRKAAASSLLDGFVSCMFVRRGEPDPRVGPRCGSSPDCEPGLVCNEYHACTRPPRPFNLRMAYTALRVLTTEWTDELHEATNELKVRAFERELDRVSKHDVPIAVQMMDKAEVFTAVLDETPEAGLPEKLDAYETIEERVQRVPHWARIGVWEIASGRQLLRLRARADGAFVAVGEHHSLNVPGAERDEAQQRNVAAQQRQANGCALALATKAAVARRGGGAAPDRGGPQPVPAGSGEAAGRTAPAPSAPAASP